MSTDALVRPFILALSLAAAGCAGPESDNAGNSDADAAVGDASDVWQTLFDGTDLSRWNIVGEANWEIVDGAVRADMSPEASFLVSDVDYGDFDLTLEFWVDVDANSGVFLRCTNPEQIGADSCYEVNIFDTRPDQTYRTGSIVDYAAPDAIVYTGGRWNRFDISAHGNRLEVTLNGVPTVDIEDSTYTSGPIALQYGAGIVMFRDVRIRTP